MKHNRPTNADLLLLMAFAIGLLCMALAGCGTTSATVATHKIQLVATMDVTAKTPYNQINFYSKNPADANFTPIGSMATTNGIAAVTNGSITQPSGSTKIYAAEVTNTTVEGRTFEDLKLMATNAI
jgi:hypothetical protein